LSHSINDTGSHSSTCRNCGATLAGPYCHACGQKVDERDTSLRGFLRDAFGELFEFRSRTLTTILHLFTKPGVPTRAYFNGQRIRYAQPIQIYLIAAAVFFSANSLNSFIVLSDSNKVTSMLGAMRAGQQLSNQRIAELEQAGMPLPLFRERFESIVSDTLPHFLLGAVIAFGFAIWLFHPRTPALYHFVFSLHWTGFFLLVMGIERIFVSGWEGGVWIRLVLNLVAVIHLFLSLRTVYGYGNVRALLSCFGLTIVFNLILIIWVLSVGFFAIKTIG